MTPMLHSFSILTVFLTFALITSSFAQGPLAPTGGPAPVMKSLDQIEPRKPISAITTPGTATATFRISQPGSYYLTGPVSGEPGKHAILINSDRVNLDLNGFTINSAGLNGIHCTSRMPTIRNGFIAYSGDEGIFIDIQTSFSGALIENIHVMENGRSGIRGTHGTVVRHCVAWSNNFSGIYAVNSTIENCTALFNGQTGIDGPGSAILNCNAYGNQKGISAYYGGSVLNCVSTYNSDVGITLTFNAIATGCSSRNNGGVGIFANQGCIIRQCSAALNDGHGIHTTEGGNTIENNNCTENVMDGIRAVSGCSIRGNTCSQNGRDAGIGAGIYTTGGDNRIEDNTCSGNDRGLHITSSGSLILRNTCAANSLVNYEIAASNRVGIIVAAPSSAAISGSSGGAGVGTDNPWANFSF